MTGRARAGSQVSRLPKVYLPPLYGALGAAAHFGGTKVPPSVRKHPRTSAVFLCFWRNSHNRSGGEEALQTISKPYYVSLRISRGFWTLSSEYTRTLPG